MCTSIRRTLAERLIAISPACASILPRLLPSHPTGSTFPCQAPAGCCLMPVLAAHQQGSHRPPQRGNGPAERFRHCRRGETPCKPQQNLLWLQKKNRQQILTWPRAQQLDSLRTRSKLEVPWLMPMCIHARARPVNIPPPPRDIKQGGSSAQIWSTDTSAQTQPGNALRFMTEPDKPNPWHSVQCSGHWPCTQLSPHGMSATPGMSRCCGIEPSRYISSSQSPNPKCEPLPSPNLHTSIPMQRRQLPAQAPCVHRLQCRRTRLQLKCILDKSVAISQHWRRSQR